jgi:hypothetical protein
MFTYDFIKEQGLRNLHTCPFGKSHVYSWLGFSTPFKERKVLKNKIKK